jgi:hypothetical protein
VEKLSSPAFADPHKGIALGDRAGALMSDFGVNVRPVSHLLDRLIRHQSQLQSRWHILA